MLEQSTTFKSDELRLLSVIRLESFERHWRFFGHQLELWRAELARINDRYLEDAATLGKRKASWRATLASAEEQGIPRALVDLITALQADLAKAEQALSVPLNHQIQLNQRASALEADIQNGQRVVAEAIIYSDSRLTKIDAPPLWTALGHSNDSDVDSVAKVCKWKGCF